MAYTLQHDVVIAEQVGQHLERFLMESTIRTVLRRPEEKGYVELKLVISRSEGAVCLTRILQFIRFMIHRKAIPSGSFSEEARESVDRSGCYRAAGQPAGS